VPPEFVLTVILAVVAIAGTMGVLKTWLNRPNRAAIPQADLKEIREGLARMEQSIDVIAVEVERLSEGQRFTTKLLSDQGRGVPQIPPAIRQGGTT
jgi:hypothetical protein